MALLGGMKFPEVLWCILNDDRFESIYWSRDGTSVLVREQDFVEEVLEAEGPKKVFQTNSFASFIRNLNFYGFACRRISTENDTNIHSCFCPYFQRGRPELRYRVSRGPNSRRWLALFDPDGTPKQGVKGLLEDLTHRNKRRSVFTDVHRDEELAAKFVRIAPKSSRPVAAVSSPAALLLGQHNISNTVEKGLQEPTIQPRRLSSLRPPSPSLKRLVNEALEIPTTQPLQPYVLIPQQQESGESAQLVYMLPVAVSQSQVEMATTAVQTSATFTTAPTQNSVFTQTPMSAPEKDLPKSSRSPESSPLEIPTPAEGHPAKQSTDDDDVMLHMTCEDDISTTEDDKLCSTKFGRKVVRRAARNQARSTRVLKRH